MCENIWCKYKYFIYKNDILRDNFSGLVKFMFSFFSYVSNMRDEVIVFKLSIS